MSTGGTFHTYFTVCSEEVHRKYGSLDDNLILRNIFTVGLERPDGIRGKDNKVYHFALLVLSRDNIADEMSTLFPEIDGWIHQLSQRNEEVAKRMQETLRERGEQA